MNEEEQSLINEMLSSALDPEAQERRMEIFQQVSELPLFCFYLVSSVSNEELSFLARTEAAHLIRHRIASLDEESKQSIIEALESVLFPCLLCDDKTFVRSVSALISEIVYTSGDPESLNIAPHIDELLSNEETLFAGFDLLHELSLHNFFFDGEYFAHIPEIVYGDDIDLAIEAINFTLQLSENKPEAVKDGIVIPILTHGDVMQMLSDTVNVVIISIIENLMDTEEEDFSVNEEERTLFTAFLKSCLMSNHSGLAIPAADVYIKYPNDYDEELCLYLYKKLSQDDYVCDTSFSGHCYEILSKIATQDQENVVPLLLQFVQEGLASEDAQDFISTMRALSLLAPLIVDKSEIIPIVEPFLSLETDPVFRREAILCISEMAKSDVSIAPPAFDTILPMLSDEDVEIRMQVLRVLPSFFEIVEYDFNQCLGALMEEMERIDDYEGPLLLKTILSLIDNTETIEESEVFNSFIQVILECIFKYHQSELQFSYSLEIMETIIAKLPACVECLQSEEFFGKILQVFSLEEKDDSVCNLILILLSTSLTAQKELSIEVNGEFYSEVAKFAISIFGSDLISTQVSAWEFLSVLLESGLPFNDYIDPIIQSISSDYIGGQQFNEDIAGNVAYFMFNFLQKIDFNEELTKHIFTLLSAALLDVEDDINQKNMCCSILLCAKLLKVEEIDSIEVLSEEVKTKIHELVSSLLFDTSTPEKVRELCKMFNK